MSGSPTQICPLSFSSSDFSYPGSVGFEVAVSGTLCCRVALCLRPALCLIGSTTTRCEIRYSLCRALMSRLLEMVQSVGSLMESGLEDGEDPIVISSGYINVLCQVTSTTGVLNFETGEWRSSPFSNLTRIRKRA